MVRFLRDVVVKKQFIQHDRGQVQGQRLQKEICIHRERSLLLPALFFLRGTQRIKFFCYGP